MKPMTRRIWIFVGLKAKEIGIVLAWIVGIISVSANIIIAFYLLYRGHAINGWDVEGAWFGATMSYFGIGLITSIIVALWPKIKKWIKSNWRKAGQIERRTRKK